MKTKLLLALVALGVLAGVLLAQPDELALADRRALAAPASAERELADLASYLAPSHFSSRQKARSIFRWLTDRIAYDGEGLRNNQLGDQSAAAVLLRRKAVCAGYARLFEDLAVRAGLKAVVIGGESKFNDQLPMALPPGVSGHAWNGVFVAGRWYLLDPTWAAGKLDSQMRFRRDFDDFWFCTPERQFCYTHWPRDSRWQLMSQPWSRQRFEAQPILSSQFFRLGLELPASLTQPLSVGSEASLSWPAPTEVIGLCELKDSGGRSLEGWSFCQSPRGRLETRFRCPGSGNYQWILYAQPRQPAWAGKVSPGGTGQSSPYSAVAHIKVIATSRSQRPFPRTFASFQRAGAELLQPFEGRLPAGRAQRFRVKVPGASKVMAFAGQNKVAEFRPQSSEVFELDLTPSAGQPPLQICASYGQDRRCWGLLEYLVVSQSLISGEMP